MNSNNKMYNRGCLMPLDHNTAAGALQMVVRATMCKKAATPSGVKDVIEIYGTGTYAGPSGIEYSLGRGVLSADGSVWIQATAWESKATFTGNMHLQAGDIITVYAKDWHVIVYDGKKRLCCTVYKVEVDKRKGGKAYVPTGDSAENAEPVSSSGKAVEADPAVCVSDNNEDVSYPSDAQKRELVSLYKFYGKDLKEAMRECGWQDGQLMDMGMYRQVEAKLYDSDEIIW